MVKEDQIVIDFSDIAQVRFVCAGCKSQVTQSIDCEHFPTACPSCRANWQATDDAKFAGTLWETLRSLKNYQWHHVTFKLVLKPGADCPVELP